MCFVTPDSKQQLRVCADSLGCVLEKQAAAVDSLAAAICDMQYRATTSVQCARDGAAAILNALSRRAQACVSCANRTITSFLASCTKALDDANVLAKFLDAVLAMCNARLQSSLVLASVRCVIDLTSIEYSLAVSLPTCCVDVIVLNHIFTIWTDVIDGRTSALTGPGLSRFVKGAAGKSANIITIVPRLPSGVIAEYIKPTDVVVVLTNDEHEWFETDVCAVQASESDPLCIAYTVDPACANLLGLVVLVCSIPIGSVNVIRCGYVATHGCDAVISHDVGRDYKLGMAVNCDGTKLVVSCYYTYEIRMYQLTPSLAHVGSVGSEGAGPLQFASPCGVCFAADDDILVCDRSHNRVQQLTFTGGWVATVAVSAAPACVALQNNVLAIGTESKGVELRALGSGVFIRRIGHAQEGDTGPITSVQFTLDGSRILVAQYRHAGVFMYSIDGLLLKHVGADMLTQRNDGCLAVSSSGEIIVSDHANHRICVFSPDGAECVHAWGTRGTKPGQFEFPSLLAVSGTRLFVMDTQRVHVFE